jgi:NADH:ubiquinone oxidoreductase subunit
VNKNILQLFTWWNGATIGTRFWLWRNKVAQVGTDEFGNVYYRKPATKTQEERRWVTYAGEVEASAVPPGWRGWLTFTYDDPPSETPYSVREWEVVHRSNMTGTPQAYRPQGSTLATGRRRKTGGDYEAWTPGN